MTDSRTDSRTLTVLRKLIVDTVNADPHLPWGHLDDEVAERVAAAVLSQFNGLQPAEIRTPALNLSDFARPTGFSTEWVYGPARNDWLRSHPITAYDDAEEGEPTVEFSGPLGLSRDQIPHLIAWLTAVHEATAPAADVEEVAS